MRVRVLGWKYRVVEVGLGYRVVWGSGQGAR